MPPLNASGKGGLRGEPIRDLQDTEWERAPPCYGLCPVAQRAGSLMSAWRS